MAGQVLSFYKEKLAELQERLAAAGVGEGELARRSSANLDDDLETLSDLAGAFSCKL